jgi:hypothetical protein
MTKTDTGKFDGIKIIFKSQDSEPSGSVDVDVDSFDLNKQKAIRYNQDTKERRRLARWVRWVVSLWLTFVAFSLVFNNILCLKLSDTVMCMLLGTTTVNILGLAYIY